MSLADEFLADIDYEDLADEGIDSNNANENDRDHRKRTREDEQDLMAFEEEEDDFDMEIKDEDDDPANSALEQMLKEVQGAENVRDIAKLLDSQELNEMMDRINHFQSLTDSKGSDVSGLVEDDPEYQLIVKANNISVTIDNEIVVVHKFIRDHYAPKFPELETLVPNALDYARTVLRIANQMDITKVDLQDILPSATVMVITVTGTTTEGRALTDSEWAACEDACHIALGLESTKTKIIEYVESRMMFIAPNLSAIIGTATAAKIMGVAGGLTALSKMPACNIQLLGKVKNTNRSLSSALNHRHVGYIYFSPLVSGLPSDIRSKAQRILAAKLTLAARIDRVHSYPDGDWGRKAKDEVENRLQKMLEPPPQKKVKALPAPLEAPKKKRGGRRARQQKELYAVSEMQKLQNRVEFGVEEQEIQVFGSTEGLGMLGQSSNVLSGGARIRAAQADDRNRGKISNRNAARLAQYGASQARSLNGLSTSGTASSLAFTPIQGIELVDPTAAAQKVKEANERYFGTGGFLKIGQNKKPAPAK